MKNKARVLALVALSCILVLITVYGLNRVQSVLSNSQSAVGDELSKVLHTKVSVGNISMTSFNTLTVNDTAVYDKQGQILAKVGKVNVTYSPLNLLQGQAAAESITKLSLEAPQVYLRQHADGRWNIEELLPKEQKEPSPFKGRVSVNNAALDIVMSKGSWQVNSINGEIDFSQNPTTLFAMTGKHSDSTVIINGNAGLDNRMALNINIDKANIEDISTLLPYGLPIEGVQGRLYNIRLTLDGIKNDIKYFGELDFTDTAASVKKIDVNGAAGYLTFNNKEVHLYHTRLNIAGQSLKASGKINIDASEPTFDLHIQTKNFNPAAVYAEMPYDALIDADAKVTGTTSKPIVDGVFTVHTLGGKIFGSGRLEPLNLRYSLNLKGRHIDTQVLDAFLPTLTGFGDFDMFVDGEGDIKNTIVYGTASMPEAIFQNTSFTNVALSFYKKADYLKVDYLTAALSCGIISAQGEINGGNFNFDFSGQQVELSILSSLMKDAQLSGLADFSGKVSGSVDNPRVIAAFRAQNGQMLYQPYSLATGHITINKQQAVMEDVEVTDGKANHFVKGTIELAGRQEVNLSVITRQARAENIIKLLSPGERLTGNVDNDMTITGPLDDFTVYGSMVLTEGSFRGQLIARAEGTYHREHGITSLDNFNINSLNTYIKLSGTVSPGNEFNLAVTADDIDIARLHMRLPYELKGQASFTGKLTGTAEKPIFIGKLISKSLSLNGQEAFDVNANLNIMGSQIDIPQFSFRQKEGTYDFTGGINIDSGDIYGSLDVDKGDVGALFNMLNTKQNNVSGCLNGHILISGKINQPNIFVTGKMFDGKIKNYPLDSIDIDLALQNNILTVNEFKAKQGNGVLAMRGTADLQGPLSIEIGGQGIDAGLLTAWFDTKFETTGALNFNAQISGTADRPHTAISMEVANGRIGSAAFDVLYGLFIIKDESININQLYIAKGPYKASAYGLVPLKALNTQGREQASITDQMDLKVKLDKANLSILPLLTKEVSWADGETKGEITVSGTLVQPKFYGQILVNEGTVKLASLTDPIQKVGVDIELEGDKINVQSFEGRSGSGRYSLTGTAALHGLAVEDYNLSLLLDNLSINSKYFKGPLNGNLQLATIAKRPRLSGNILLERDTLNIPMVPEVKESSYDLDLDVAVKIGNRVRLYNPYLYDILVEGQVKAEGSMREPDIAGQVHAVRGSVSYLRSQFKIKEGLAAFTGFGSFEPIIKLSAQTKLEKTVVNLNINGPISQMELKLSSEPNMSQQEIITLLTLRSNYNNHTDSGKAPELGREEMIGLLDAGLQMRFISELENSLKKALGLDDFRIVRANLYAEKANGDNKDSPNDNADADTLDERGGYNLEISKYISDRVLLTYTTGLDYKAYSMGFQYDINKRISLTGSVDDKNRSRFGFEMRFSF